MNQPKLATSLLIGEWERPCVEAICILHRGTDGYVTFHRKTNGVWTDLLTLRADELTTMFPTFLAEFQADSFFSVNSFYKHGGKSLEVPGACRPFRRQTALRYLCACYADLDYYKLGLHPEHLLETVVVMQERGEIPPVSLISRSGRGMWLFWLLRDPDNLDQPQRARAEKVRLYLEIQYALYLKLSRLGSDAQARDAVRVTRVPGSLHSGSNQHVLYFRYLDIPGKHRVYTLTELARFLSIEPRRIAVGSSGRKNHSNGKAGWTALYQLRLRQLELLEKIRDGFREGCRNQAAFLYAHFLRKNGRSSEQVRKSVMRLASACRPPLSSRECSDTIKSGSQDAIRRVRNSTISDWLEVTPEEAQQLETWRPASRFLPLDLPNDREVKRSIKERIEARRDAIRLIISESVRVPSLREMSRLLECRQISAGPNTVAGDYRKLGIFTDWRPTLEENMLERLA